MNLISESYSIVKFLFNINDLRNLKSIFQHGILSKNEKLIRDISSTDLSNPDVQKRRDDKRIPNHGMLHDYANLYFNPRNPMMYYLINHKKIDDLCIVCVDKRVLDLEGTVVSDRNAASELAAFESEMKTLVNTINCVGVMGKGIAKIYKDRYPKMFEEYKDMCTKKLIHTGYLYPYYEDNSVKILNFPTKQHWRSPSKLEYIQEGLNWFIQNYERLKITSIAFPPLGCGNGGLDWETVGPLMYQSLKDLPIDIEIYAPFGTEKSKLQVEFLLVNENKVNKTGVIYEKINNNWLLV